MGSGRVVGDSVTLGSVDIQAIRTALKSRLDAALNPSSPTTVVVNVYANPVADPIPPCITIRTPSGDYVSYWETMGPAGMTDVFFELEIDPGCQWIDATIALDNYLGVGTTLSIVSAIDADVKLGNVVQTVQLLKAVGGNEFDGWRPRIPVAVVAKKGGN